MSIETKIGLIIAGLYILYSIVKGFIKPSNSKEKESTSRDDVDDAISNDDDNDTDSDSLDLDF